MIMIVNPGTTVVARNPTTDARREAGRKAVTVTAKTTFRKGTAAVVSPAGGIHQARAASIKGVVVSRAVVGINQAARSQAAVINRAAAIEVNKAIMKAGSGTAGTAAARAKATT